MERHVDGWHAQRPHRTRQSEHDASGDEVERPNEAHNEHATK